MNCPHCGGALLSHGDTGHKAGRMHCNGCGCCFLGGHVAPGTPQCRESQVREMKAAEPVATAEPFVNPGIRPVSVAKVVGGRQGVAEADAVAPEDSPTPERRVRRQK